MPINILRLGVHDRPLYKPIPAGLNEIMDAPLVGSWDEFCTEYGYDEYCVAEGGDPDHEVEITVSEARRWGLLKDEEKQND